MATGCPKTRNTRTSIKIYVINNVYTNCFTYIRLSLNLILSTERSENRNSMLNNTEAHNVLLLKYLIKRKTD